MTIFSARRAAMLVGLATVLATPAFAADKDPVVAVVNGTELRASALAGYQRTLPPQMAAQVPYEALLDSLINNTLVFEQGKKDGMDKDPDVKRALKDIEQQLVVKAWMSKKLKAEVTDEAVKKAYDKFLAEYKPAEEVRARHILVDNEDAAKAIIADLKKGADFTEQAKTKSKDPSAKQNGGDLGYFTKDEMVPQFAEAAFAMKPGELSQTPVKSQFGWHVIKVEDRRMSSPPSLEQAQPAIREKLAEDTAERLVTDIRAKAKVKRFDMEGKPLAEAK
ncbi:MAG TPA: peptidylprolyl isomerase [Magnetospirillum sp.]|jgi:peptidyl-prolyl cis-trans isomerase C|nr:peptidylprolyl isomerase [Magnetospirillum sp.]